MFSKLKYDLLNNKRIHENINLEELFNNFNFDYFKLIDDYKLNFLIGFFLLKKGLIPEALYFINKSILNNNEDEKLLDICRICLSKIEINRFNFIIKNNNNLFLKETIENIIPFSNKIFLLNSKNYNLKYNVSFIDSESKSEFLNFISNLEKPLIILNSGEEIAKDTIAKIVFNNYTDNYSFIISTDSNNSYTSIKNRELTLINNNKNIFINENFYIQKIYSKLDIFLDLSSDLINNNYNSEEIINKTLEIIEDNYNSFSLYKFFYMSINYYLKKDLNRAKNIIIKSLNSYKNDSIFTEMLINISILENDFISAEKICINYLRIIPKDLKFMSILHYIKEQLEYPKFEQDNTLINGLSVCIIVKDEEEYIAKCINSVKDIADEIIVLDTGSTDNTVSIAKNGGAKVFYYTWNKNFSDAKNKSIEYAKYKWVFILDSDEVFINSNEIKKEIIKNLNDNNLLAIDIRRIEKIDNSEIYLTRIFRKHREIYYEGPIHEQINSTLNKALDKYNMKIKHLNIEILHYGYLDKVMKRKNTNKRNIEILAISIEKNIEKKETILYYKIKYLCNLIDLEKDNLLEKNKLNEIEKLIKDIYLDYTNFRTIKDIDLFIPTIQYAESIFTRMIKNSKYYEALQFNSFFVKYFPNSITINYNQSFSLYKNNRFFEALLYAKKAFYLYLIDSGDRSSLYNEDIGKKSVPFIIALIYEVLEYYELSSYWFNHLLEIYQDFKEAKEGLKRVENRKDKNTLISVGILCESNSIKTSKNIIKYKNLAEELILFDKYSMIENLLLAKKYNIKYFQCVSYEKVEALLNFNKKIIV